MEKFIDSEDLKKTFLDMLICAKSWDPKALLIGNVSADDIATACQAVLNDNMDLTLKSKHNSIKVKTWAITPPTFEELWNDIEGNLENLDYHTLEIIKTISKNIYFKFYQNIKKQLEK